MQVQWSTEHRQQVERHALETFPEECCGFLFGLQIVEGWLLKEIRPSKNLSAMPRTGFLFDAREQVKALKDADAKHLEIIGYYHSHPNGRRGPSPTDFILWGGDHDFLTAEERSTLPGDLQNSEIQRLPDHALQIIVALEQGVVTDVGGWQLRRDLHGFHKIDMEFFR